MVSSTDHGGSEPVTLSMSPDSGNTTQESACSAPATPHMSAEYNSPELGLGQPMAVNRKQLPSIIPGGAPIFVSEKQYDAILRLRERRARVKARREKHMLKVKNYRPRGAKGRFIAYKGNQEGTSGGSSQEPSSIPVVDLYWRFAATNDDEENIGEVAYDSILNLETPDLTAILRIMMGDRYSTEVASQFENVARLEAPDFATLLTIMNNAGYDEATDDGYYDVVKVMLKLQGW